MNISDTGEVWGLLMQNPRRETADTKRRESVLTLSRYVVEPSQRALRISMLLLLTSAAGRTDVPCYLAVGQVFASFMTGNMLSRRLVSSLPCLTERSGRARDPRGDGITPGALCRHPLR